MNFIYIKILKTNFPSNIDYINSLFLFNLITSYFNKYSILGRPIFVYVIKTILRISLFSFKRSGFRIE